MGRSTLRKRLGMLRATWRNESAFPNGHASSPIVSPADLVARADLWPGSGQAQGLTIRDDYHRDFIAGPLTEWKALYDYPDRSDSGYYSANPFFGWLDSRVLLAMITQHRPARIIEVGSGFSSLLMADVNTRRLNGTIDLTCIDPKPRTSIREVVGIAKVVTQPVQNVPTQDFARLQANDILFVDSSHVAKTGSDVVFLLLEVLPILAPGVLVHFHDVFIPFEYPKEWVLGENRSWNEQYMLQAFLSMNDSYEIRFGSFYAATTCRADLEFLFGAESDAARGGSSLWIRRTG